MYVCNGIMNMVTSTVAIRNQSSSIWVGVPYCILIQRCVSGLSFDCREPLLTVNIGTSLFARVHVVYLVIICHSRY